MINYSNNKYTSVRYHIDRTCEQVRRQRTTACCYDFITLQNDLFFLCSGNLDRVLFDDF